MDKYSLIELVRAAQAEEDPRRREELWELVRQAGLPANATILPAVEYHASSQEEKGQ